MTLELASVPLAFIAGILSILSPCVWPLVPIVMSSAAASSRSGPVFLALGLSTAFAVSGTVLTLALLNLGLNPDGFRYVAAAMLVLVAAILLVKPLGDWVVLGLSGVTSRFDTATGGQGGAAAQFGPLDARCRLTYPSAFAFAHPRAPMERGPEHGRRPRFTVSPPPFPPLQRRRPDRRRGRL
jgi:cytochrome c-type biogenesis protein